MTPTLNPEETARATALSNYLRQHMIAAPLPFRLFMENCLYHPQWGYYTHQAGQFGRQGDFITAPELTPVFGHTLAKSLANILAQIPEGGLVEVGAGTGALAMSILTKLAELKQLPSYYHIIEISPALRRLQQENLKKLGAHIFSRVRWLDELPKNVRGVIFCNELLDALPITLYYWRKQQLVELGVIWEDNQFQWAEIPVTAIPEYVEAITHTLADDYWLEYHDQALSWLEKANDALKQGVILCFDYGFDQKQYYYPERNRGTLMSFCKHLAGVDPLINPGLQDLTCHVNFSLLQQQALNLGLDIKGYTTQAHFLMTCGLDFTPNLSVADQYQQAQMFKRLLLPSEMGELIKVLALGRGIDSELLGF